MFLKRLEAVRYGAFENRVLGDFAPNLTVCFGSNEAGKSTFTSLTRHVLYGFPRGRVTERLYLPPGGENRVGRLVFGGSEDEIVIERTEGVRGGDVTIATGSGKEHDNALLEAITAGVSVGVYRTVFGFSLEELSDMNSLADIQSRLYATTTGLDVNPHDVVERLNERAEALWAPRARTKALHELGKELRKVREDLRSVDELAERYRVDRVRRGEVAAELEVVEGKLRAARVESERLAALLAEGRRFEERIAEHEEAASKAVLEADRCAREAVQLEVDEELLAGAEAIEHLGMRFALFRSEVDQLRRDHDRLQELQRDLERRARDMGEGFSLDEASDVHFDLDLENYLAEAEQKIQALRLEHDAAARRAKEAQFEHQEALAAASARSRELGLGDDQTGKQEVASRIETVDRLLAIGSGPGTLGAFGYLAGAAAVMTVALVVSGVLLDDRNLVWAALLPGLLAVALLLVGRHVRHTLPGEVFDLAAALGRDEPLDPRELVDLRSRLEGARQLWAAEEQLGRKASVQQAVAQAAAEEHEREWLEWIEWLERHKLQTGSGEPESVRRVMRLLRDLRTRLEGRQELEALIEERHASCREFVDHARRIGAVSEHDSGLECYREIEHSVRTILARLGAARRLAETQRELQTAEATARERAEAAADAATSARQGLQTALERAGLGDDAGLADLEAAVAVARQAAAEVESERSELLETRGTLDGRLETGAEEADSVRLRLAEEGLEERIAEAVEQYAIFAAAARLLEESLELYEAQKQPAVIQSAQHLFAALTDGRYTRLATPLGSFEPVVGSGRGTGKEPELLSRATAEQLFLALRMSYLENLANAHPALPVIMDDVLVNFDDTRRRAAAEVIADFATGRQVIFFTCHPATVEAFRRAPGGSSVIEMG